MVLSMSILAILSPGPLLAKQRRRQIRDESQTVREVVGVQHQQQRESEKAPREGRNDHTSALTT